MTPLLDRLRAGDPLPPWWIESGKLDDWRRHRDGIMLLVRDPSLPVFSIDDIAHYYYEVSDRERWDATEFPDLKVPHGGCWMEHRLPRRIHSEVGDREMGRRYEGHAGWLAFSTPRADVEGEGIPEKATHILWFELFVFYAFHASLEGPHGSWFVAVDERGSIVSPPTLQTWAERKHAAQLESFQDGFLNVALLAISGLPVTGLRGPVRLVRLSRPGSPARK